jgi:hypothetical protein
MSPLCKRRRDGVDTIDDLSVKTDKVIAAGGTNMCRKARRILAFVSFFIIVSLITGWNLLSAQRDNRFRSLLRGDSVVTISLMTVHGHGERYEFSDESALDYLTKSFRNAKYEGFVPAHSGGVSYESVLDIGTMLSLRVGLSLASDSSGVTVAFPVDRIGDPEYYWVPFDQPVPSNIQRALAAMQLE